MINVKDSYLLAVIFTALSLLSACSGNHSSAPELLNIPQPQKSVEVAETVDIGYVFVGVGGEITFQTETDVSTSSGQGRIVGTSKTIYDSSRAIPREFGFQDPDGGPYLIIKSHSKDNDSMEFVLSSTNYIGKSGVSVLSFSDEVYDLASTNTYNDSRAAGDQSYQLGQVDLSNSSKVLYDRNTHNEIGEFIYSSKDTPVQLESVSVPAGSYQALKFQFESNSRSIINGNLVTETWRGNYWIDVPTGQLVQVVRSGQQYYAKEGNTYSLVEVRKLSEIKKAAQTSSVDQTVDSPAFRSTSLM